MPGLQYYWLSIPKEDQCDVIVPDDLRDVIEKCERVRRFQDPQYPEQAFNDNVHAHIFRMVRRANLLQIDSQTKQKIIRMIWIHDVPEAYSNSGRDFTSVEKEQNKILANRIEIQENEIANKIFSKKDLYLYHEYEKSKEALKSGINNSNMSFAGIVARILDTTDGNMSFHFFLTNWIRSGYFKLSKMPPNQALSYSFRYTESTNNNVMHLGLSDAELNMTRALISEHILYIKSLWKCIDKAVLPEEIKEYIGKE